jgi:hypothetical protein
VRRDAGARGGRRARTGHRRRPSACRPGDGRPDQRNRARDESPPCAPRVGSKSRRCPGRLRVRGAISRGGRVFCEPASAAGLAVLRRVGLRPVGAVHPHRPWAQGHGRGARRGYAVVAPTVEASSRCSREVARPRRPRTSDKGSTAPPRHSALERAGRGAERRQRPWRSKARAWTVPRDLGHLALRAFAQFARRPGATASASSAIPLERGLGSSASDRAGADRRGAVAGALPTCGAARGGRPSRPQRQPRRGALRRRHRGVARAGVSGAPARCRPALADPFSPPRVQARNRSLLCHSQSRTTMPSQTPRPRRCSARRHRAGPELFGQAFDDRLHRPSGSPPPLLAPSRAAAARAASCALAPGPR